MSIYVQTWGFNKDKMTEMISILSIYVRRALDNFTQAHIEVKLGHCHNSS